jgi:uncharacterized membrane protein YoaK (UPF0700 family)
VAEAPSSDVSAERNLLGLALTATAGWVDAVGLFRLQGYTVSFMSGNTTRLSVALSDDQWALAVLGAAVLMLFFVGSFLGGLTAALPERWGLPMILAVESVFLAAALCLSAARFERDSLLTLAVAMGVQNGAIFQLRPGATTFVTGTLFRAGHELARSLVGVRDASWLPQLLTWFSFVLGSAAGAVANASWEMGALALPLVIAVVCGVTALARSKRTKEIVT